MTHFESWRRNPRGFSNTWCENNLKLRKKTTQIKFRLQENSKPQRWKRLNGSTLRHITNHLSINQPLSFTTPSIKTTPPPSTTSLREITSAWFWKENLFEVKRKQNEGLFPFREKRKKLFWRLEKCVEKSKAKKLKLICRQIYKHKIYLQKSTLLKRELFIVTFYKNFSHHPPCFSYVQRHYKTFLPLSSQVERT